jgi:hypothetical protein
MPLYTNLALVLVLVLVIVLVGHWYLFWYGYGFLELAGRLGEGSARALGGSRGPGGSHGAFGRLQEVLRRSGHRQIVIYIVYTMTFTKSVNKYYVSNDYHLKIMIWLYVFVKNSNFTSCV